MRKQSMVIVLLVSMMLGMVFVAPESKAAFDCLTLNSSSSADEKSYCKNELADIEAELVKLLELQKQQKKQTGTLVGDVNYLTSQINALKSKIQSRALVIAHLKVAITEKISTITSLNKKIAREHESIAQLLRNTNSFDDENLVHLVLSDATISNFYSDLESYSSIKKAVQKSVDTIRGVKTENEAAKSDLEKKRNAETDAKAELENAERKVALSEAEKKSLLAISKQTEASYQKLAAEKLAQANKIRAALFPLAGISTKIDFGTAFIYAKNAKDATGIDPAFLLAVLTQESNLGGNVGQCLLTDLKTGAGVGKNTGTSFPNVMKPMGLPGRKGDIDDFLAITSKLGREWEQTPVSCPIAGVAGYGGAMGPAQFIPSTWGGYVSRFKTVLGHDADPWAPRDAFFASAIFLTDLGAVGDSASAQNIAACKYYGTGGASCSYGRSVMTLKAKIQADIDLLSS